jgi:uncharacterized OB-fold protein
MTEPTAVKPAPRPAFPFLWTDEHGQPRQRALSCNACGASYAAHTRLACARCGAGAEQLLPFEPASTGTLHAGSIVWRGYPGTPTPFISAVVDLDGGPVLKGMLRAVSCEPHEIAQGRRVRVVFGDALGRTDAQGNAYFSHFFEPLEPEERA